MAALRRARHRLAAMPVAREPEPAPLAEGGPDEAAGAPSERRQGDGHYLRLVPGLLPAGPFLPPGDLVVVDVETTGWLADAAGITEIGAVRLSPGRPVAEFSALVNPGAPIPANITELTGITDAMVACAPPIGEVLPQFMEFAGSCVIVAHNAPFDIAFLEAACERSGIAWPPRAVIDTAVLSRLLLGPDVPDHRLATLSCHFDVAAEPCHRALADARATAAVLRGLLGVLGRGPRAAPRPRPAAGQEGPKQAAGQEGPRPPARRADTMSPQQAPRFTRLRRRPWSPRSS